MHLRLDTIAGRLPTSIFSLMDGEERIGFVQVRHRPSNGEGVPPECASHIYYEVEPNKRRRGYGTQALALAKIEAIKLVLSEIIVTCHQQNEASRRIIERNGGVFELAAQTNDGDTMLKFRIDLAA